MADEIKKPKFALGENVYLAKLSFVWPDAGVWPFQVHGILEDSQKGFLYTQFRAENNREWNGARWIAEDSLFCSSLDAADAVKSFIQDGASQNIEFVDEMVKHMV